MNKLRQSIYFNSVCLCLLSLLYLSTKAEGDVEMYVS